MNVLYIHTCEDGMKCALIIQYINAEHEKLNLKTTKEHHCGRCGKPMERIGIAHEVKNKPELEGWTYDKPIASSIPSN